MGIKHLRSGLVRYSGDFVTTSTHRTCVYCKLLFPHMDLLQHMYNCSKSVSTIDISDVVNCVYCNVQFPMATVFHHIINCEIRINTNTLNIHQILAEIAIKVFGFENLNKKVIRWSKSVKHIAISFYKIIDYIRDQQHMPRTNIYGFIIPEYILHVFCNQFHQLYYETIVIVPELLKKVNKKIPRPAKFWLSKFEPTEDKQIIKFPPNYWLSEEVPLLFRQPTREEDGMYRKEYIMTNRPEAFVNDL